ncbi:hypothetical protein FDF26_07055 [Clostridium botulinum]|nr:hypothetical protein [Clostridium botulinum]
MKLTSNYSLKKPDGSDVVNVQDFNDNSDKIDLELKNVDSQMKENTKNIKDVDGSNAYISNANNCGIAGKRTTHRTSSNTLNTPYKQGLTLGYVEGIVDTYLNSTNFGIQIGYATGNELFKRSLISGTWSEWKRLATVDDTGWIDLPLLNGATTTSDKALYRRIGKMVYFKGVVNNITSDGFIFGNLPIGFRPNSESGGGNIPVSLFLPGEDTPSRLIVYKNGNLQLSRRNYNNTCYLDGVTFVLD